MKILSLLLIIANLVTTNASAEVRLHCVSEDNTHILPLGDDSILTAEINENFGGYLSVSGDAGIWSHLQFSEKQDNQLVFVSIEPESALQAKHLLAFVDEALLSGEAGTIHFTSLVDPTVLKNYNCETASN